MAECIDDSVLLEMVVADLKTSYGYDEETAIEDAPAIAHTVTEAMWDAYSSTLDNEAKKGKPMSKIADYYNGMDKIIEESGNPDVFKISPSSVADFFTSTSQYYREQVLGEEKAFQGSTSTHLGTIVHHCAEEAAKGRSLDTMEPDVKEFLATIEDPEVDKESITQLWYPMADVLISNAITPDDRVIVGTEEFLCHKLNDDVYVGGTYDALVEDRGDYGGGLCVVDYKTASTKPQGINYKYKLQAYTYAWMLREAGKNITSIELSFVQRPTKTLPVRYFNYKEPYTDQNHQFIGSILNLIAESVSKFKSTPELRHLLAQDARLKEGAAPVAFPLL